VRQQAAIYCTALYYERYKLAKQKNKKQKKEKHKETALF
jgi:hypothetical protein